MSKPHVKTFPSRSAAEIEMLVFHARKIEQALRRCDLVIFPRLIDYDATSITYSRVDCHQPFLDKVRSLSCTISEMTAIGKILKKIHHAGCLHSDYVPHNFFISKNRLVLIDPHPPDTLDCHHERLYGNSENEIAHFAFCLLSDTGLKRSLICMEHQIRMIRAFLDGYGRDGIGYSRLFKAVLICARDVYQLKRYAGFSGPRALIHSVGGSFLTFIALGVER